MPANLSQGKIRSQFEMLSKYAGIDEKIFNDLLTEMLLHSRLVEKLVFSSFLNDSTKRNYWQAYLGRLEQLIKK